ncbi:MBOAT family O-acyltransferase [Xylanibacter muris]|uniref:MBOAT family protein n=1 Tax=Xylanibacter muris TaxID=2736290 RepID=A0ABX2ALF7_9BACT|nr:MBOAT family protein [Xylanibacter muris]NPD91940.1 MBOAT family protein [Xylanibacter muris]
MVFSDLFFLFVFLPAFMLCYLMGAWVDRCLPVSRDEAGCVNMNKAKNLVLVFFSLVFYAWGEPVYVFLMLLCVLLNYLTGLCISGGNIRRKLALAFGVICNLSILGTFKYAGFFAQTINDWGVNVGVPKIALPIGISFYVFQSISYLVDVYRRESPVQRRFMDLLLYISMFPQLIAGPIVRYGTVAAEIACRKVTSGDVAAGTYRFLIGLGKKVILANQLSEISDAFLSSGTGLGELTTLGAWIGISAYTLQIYFDFSGYSDMAIGIGRCLGFHFRENFNHPYCCDTITDFWRRWHISLGSFFRDYVYIPMGGNRSHQAFNIMVVWFLTGMWHGASWNFIIWGVYFGVIVMLEKYTLLRIKDRIPSPLLHIYSMLLVIAGWGIFYFDDFNSLQLFFNAFTGNAEQFTDFVAEASLMDNFWLWIVAVAFCMPLRSYGYRLVSRITGESGCVHSAVIFTVRVVISVAMLGISAALLVGATNNAFIYTRF